jgi:fructuronate reductase
MVDRIVPAMTATDEAAAISLTGLADRAPVVHEPFRQWVIEDVLAPSARPAWERAGAEFAGDVAPYELMKLRMLNGTHSALAWLGGLDGRETIADAVADPTLRAFVQGLWREEIAPTVPPPPGIDLAAYAGDLLRRYDDAAIRHRHAQIATDSSQKLPQRLLGPIRDRLAAGARWDRLALAVAGFIRHCGGIDLAGGPIEVRDPLAGLLRDHSNGASDPATRVGEVLSVKAVFGDLADDPRFRAGVETAYGRLVRLGVREAVGATASSARE